MTNRREFTVGMLVVGVASSAKRSDDLWELREANRRTFLKGTTAMAVLVLPSGLSANQAVHESHKGAKSPGA